MDSIGRDAGAPIKMREMAGIGLMRRGAIVGFENREGSSVSRGAGTN